MTEEGPSWNFADVFEAVADSVPDRPAIVQGDRVVSWRDFDRTADGVAAALLAAGLPRQATVALYLYNCPEYLEAHLGALKAGLVPVNTNYRYRDEELLHIWSDSGAAAVVLHGSLGPAADRLRGRLPGVRVWIWVDDGAGPCPDWAVPFPAAPTERVRPPWGRTGDDLTITYTGGTTGRPRGVMWRQRDTFLSVLGGAGRQGPVHDLAGLLDAVREGPIAVGLAASPLMHGTGGTTANQALHRGGTVVLLSGRRFDAAEAWDTVAGRRVTLLGIVGDAFARPLVDVLDAEQERRDLSSLTAIFSAGAIFSESTKRRLLDHLPGVRLVDVLGSSEAPGLAGRVSRRGQEGRTAAFRLGRRARVIRPDGTDVAPGSGETGMLAVTGILPVGYHNDPERTAATFRTIGGRRYSVPGDVARVEADGTVTLLGRGTACINTGGEKVFPEEVEEALKTHRAVRDAVVVGVPDERFGEAVTALVELDGGQEVPAEVLVAHVKSVLAGYKAPRHLVVVDRVPRSAAGKVDYIAMRRQALVELGSPA